MRAERDRQTNRHADCNTSPTYRKQSDNNKNNWITQAVLSTCVPTPDALNTPVTLAFDLLTVGSVHADVLPWAICLPTLVLIALVVFLSERGQTDKQTNKQTNKQTRLIALPDAGGYIAGVGNNTECVMVCRPVVFTSANRLNAVSSKHNSSPCFVDRPTSK